MLSILTQPPDELDRWKIAPENVYDNFSLRRKSKMYL